MLKKEISYNNYNGEAVTETFYFHISQAELLRMELNLKDKGGLGEALQVMVKADDGAGIMELIETFIKKSVGRKSPDGTRFDKSLEVLHDFESSPAYDALFMDLVTNPNNAADFLNGIVPAELADNVEKLSKLDQVKANVAQRQGPKGVNTVEKPHEADVVPLEPGEPITDPTAKPRPRTLTIAEMQAMDHAELSSGLAEGRYVISND